MGISLGELILILLIAFVIVGPNDLPKIARAIGKAIRSLRQMYGEITDSIAATDEKQAIDDIKAEIKEVKTAVNSYNPKNVVKKELDSLNPITEIKSELDSLNPVTDIKNDIKSLNPLNDIKNEFDDVNKNLKDKKKQK